MFVEALGDVDVQIVRETRCGAWLVSLRTAEEEQLYQARRPILKLQLLVALVNSWCR